MFAQILVVALALALAIVQACDMPQQWQARRVAFDPNMRVYDNRSSDYRVYGTYAYDAVYLRKYMVDDLLIGQQPDDEVTILLNYVSQRYYVTQIKTGACTCGFLNETFVHHDPPAATAFVGYETLGTYPDQIQLSQYMYSAPDPHSGLLSNFYTTFTMDCVPVRYDHFNNQTGFHYEEFSDVTIGINNPNIWTPPTQCTPQGIPSC